MSISNIIIEPMSIAQQFVVYGTRGTEGNMKGVVVTLDFKDLHEPQCRGVDKAGDPDSDYEIWTPFDGRHGAQKCYLGQQISYVRRKQEAECFNGEEFDRQILRIHCACEDMDYECDSGYIRTDDARCVLVEGDSKSSTSLSEDQNEQCSNYGYYSISQGFRKVPLDMC
mmetsp:Transcript_23888/g.23576  ORF Transcript_23888/g.23576 Transcript_23888/m.23576 type:complete len:169 (-) Transcript_23888:192-698(-)